MTEEMYRLSSIEHMFCQNVEVFVCVMCTCVMYGCILSCG